MVVVSTRHTHRLFTFRGTGSMTIFFLAFDYLAVGCQSFALVLMPFPTFHQYLII